MVSFPFNTKSLINLNAITYIIVYWTQSEMLTKICHKQFVTLARQILMNGETKLTIFMKENKFWNVARKMTTIFPGINVLKEQEMASLRCRAGYEVVLARPRNNARLGPPGDADTPDLFVALNGRCKCGSWWRNVASILSSDTSVSVAYLCAVWSVYSVLW